MPITVHQKGIVAYTINCLGAKIARGNTACEFLVCVKLLMDKNNLGIQETVIQPFVWKKIDQQEDL